MYIVGYQSDGVAHVHSRGNEGLQPHVYMNIPREYGAAVSVLADGRAVVCGGREFREFACNIPAETCTGPILDTCEIFDEATGWTMVPGQLMHAGFL